MSRMVGVVVMLLCAIVLQIAMPTVGYLASAQIPFLLAAVLYYALTRNRGTMMLIACTAGLVLDSLSTMPLGYTSAGFCLVAFLSSLFRSLVYEDSLLTPIVFVAAGGAAVTLLSFALIRTGLDQQGWPIGWVLLKALGTAMMAVIVTPIVFFSARSLDTVLGGRRRAGI